MNVVRTFIILALAMLWLAPAAHAERGARTHEDRATLLSSGAVDDAGVALEAPADDGFAAPAASLPPLAVAFAARPFDDGIAPCAPLAVLRPTSCGP